MTIRFFHTSDWHLGQFFYHHSRHYEHQQFLSWLIQQIKDKQPHALLISGDIFDVINPAAAAQKQLYQFLSDAHTVAPHMQTLMIAGNHDSGYRIEQVEPLLKKYNAKAIGVIAWHEDHRLDVDRLLHPIADQQGNIIAWCLTLPFLRSAEITGYHPQLNESRTAIAHIHQQLIIEAKKRKTADQALILMSHAHMQGAETSDSERPIIIGHEEALPISLFDNSIDYVALGHLHKPQKVGLAHIRYSGSPIPLSFSEIHYKHQVVQIEIDPQQQGESRCKHEALIIPRSVQLHKIKGNLEHVFQQLQCLPQGEIHDIDQREYIDIEYFTQLPPPPNLRQLFEEQLPKNRYRLVRVARQYQSASPADSASHQLNLTPPTPEKLFREIWQKQGYQLDEDVLKDFLSLVDEAHQTLDNPRKA